jgi:hypothetical protein
MDRWESFRNTFIASYTNISSVVKQVGYDEMMSHRFVSDDHKVQESVYSSGKKVIVNFGETAYHFGKKNLPAKGFIVE